MNFVSFSGILVSFFGFHFLYLYYVFVLQRVAREAADQVMTGDLPLMQLRMARLAVVVHRDPDLMVIVDIIVILHKTVTSTPPVQTPVAVALLIDYLLLHQVLRVTDINRWLMIHVLMHFWSVRVLPPHFIPLGKQVFPILCFCQDI